MCNAALCCHLDANVGDRSSMDEADNLHCKVCGLVADMDNVDSTLACCCHLTMATMSNMMQLCISLDSLDMASDCLDHLTECACSLENWVTTADTARTSSKEEKKEKWIPLQKLQTCVPLNVQMTFSNKRFDTKICKNWRDIFATICHHQKCSQRR